MLYIALLVLHIFVACMTVVACVYSSYAILREKYRFMHVLAIAIALFAAVETVTGFMLAVLSPTVTPAYVSSHLTLYLAVCLLMEAAIALGTRRVWIG